MSIQKLRERKTAIAQAANKILTDKGDQVWTADDQKVYDNLMDDLTRVGTQIVAYQRMLDEQAEDVVRDADRPQPGDRKLSSAAATAQLEAMKLFMRLSRNDMSPEQVQQVRNAMSTTTTTEGGFTVPTTVVAMIADALKAYGGMRDVAEILTTSSGEAMNYPGSDGTAEVGEIVGENTAATGADIAFTNAVLNVYKYSSKKIAVPWELVQDSAVDIVRFVVNRLAQRLGRITNMHYTTGTGTGQPFGIVTRAGAGKVGTAGQTVTVIYDDLLDVIHSVNRAYRKQAGWMFADSTLKVIRKIKDTTGRPIFTPGYEYGITQDTPDLLLGKPITINDDMPVMAANAKSILFGDLSLYKIRDAMAVDIKRFDDSAFALNGQVGFCGWQRTGGNLVDTAGVKYYQNSAT